MYVLKDFLEDNGVYTGIFDLCRAVDVLEGLVYEIEDGELKSSGIKCTEILNCDDRCQNCTSIRAYYSNEQVVKLEYVGGKVILVISIPLMFEGKRIVAELIKDITKSMTVDMKDKHREGEVSNIISDLNKIATTDNLTGLMNRRFVDDRLQIVLDSCAEIEKPVSLILADIDDFKKINDAHGHIAGDFVLQSAAKLFKEFVRREPDFVARFGGEEFLFCFPGVDAQDCRQIAERIRHQIANTELVYEGKTIPITLSFGVADSMECDNKNPIAEKLVDIADKRLYKAKQDGKNRVV